jgi:hypothetical protein
MRRAIFAPSVNANAGETMTLDNMSEDEISAALDAALVSSALDNASPDELSWPFDEHVNVEFFKLDCSPENLAAHGVETWSQFADWVSIEARAERKQRYYKRRDAARGDKPSGPSGRRINNRPRSGGLFIAIDSEGVNVGEPIIRGKGAKQKTIQRQRTVLWMAGGAEGFQDQILADPATLDRERIWQWLLTLPRQFAGKNADDKAPIFVGFGFNYDVGQLIVGMPYKKAWELNRGVPWDKRDDPDYPESRRRWVLVGDYAISHIPHKSVVLGKLRNPAKPIVWKVNKKTGERTKHVDISERIEIYDTRGFFQSNLITAIKNYPGVDLHTAYPTKRLPSAERRRHPKALKTGRAFCFDPLENEIPSVPAIRPREKTPH